MGTLLAEKQCKNTKYTFCKTPEVFLGKYVVIMKTQMWANVCHSCGKNLEHEMLLNKRRNVCKKQWASASRVQPSVELGLHLVWRIATSIRSCHGMCASMIQTNWYRQTIPSIGRNNVPTYRPNAMTLQTSCLQLAPRMMQWVSFQPNMSWNQNNARQPVVIPAGATSNSECVFALTGGAIHSWKLWRGSTASFNWCSWKNRPRKLQLVPGRGRRHNDIISLNE